MSISSQAVIDISKMGADRARVEDIVLQMQPGVKIPACGNFIVKRHVAAIAKLCGAKVVWA